MKRLNPGAMIRGMLVAPGACTPVKLPPVRVNRPVCGFEFEVPQPY
jgi:hypothetical protein